MEASLDRFRPHGLVLFYDGKDRKGKDRYGGTQDAALWTAVALGAEALRTHAATEGPERKEALRQVESLLEAVERLRAVTGRPGLFARHYLPRSWHPTGRLEPDEHWGHGPFEGFYWLSNPSKDTYAGLLFGLTLAARLSGDEAISLRAKSLLAEMVRSLASQGWAILDLDGLPTRHGRLRPYVLGLPLFGLDALLISALCQAGSWADPSLLGPCQPYRPKAFLSRFGQTHFSLLGLYTNRSNDHMAFLAYGALLEVVENPEDRAAVVKLLERDWMEVRNEGNAFFNLIFAAYSKKPERTEAIQEALETLRAMPARKTTARVVNSDRKGVSLSWVLYKGRLQAKEPLPICLRPAVASEWAANPYRLDGGTEEGGGESPPVDFLVAYWFGRRHGLISPRD